MVRKGPLPEDLDVDYLVQEELERIRRVAWENEAAEYTAARRRERLAIAKFKAAESLDRLERRAVSDRLDKAIRAQENEWLRSHGYYRKK
jgi:hypothetical protein